MHRVRESGDDDAGCVVAVEVAIDAAVVGLLPLDVSAGVEFKEQGARRVFYRERTRGCVTPVADDQIAAVGSLNDGERVLVATRRSMIVHIVEPMLPPNITARVERRDEHAVRIGIALAD